MLDQLTEYLMGLDFNNRFMHFLQPISMNILRNDFMLDRNKKDLDVWLSNIEINTVAVSFGACTTQMNKFHKNLMHYTDNSLFLKNVCRKISRNIL